MTYSPSAQPEEHLLGQFIPLHYHFNMLKDATRMEPFREAIERVVPIGARVLELGGGTGVLSFFAAQRAAHVWCVERNPALVQAARRFLKQNRHGDLVEVIQADALEYVPPEPVDVVICEMLHVGLIREKQTQVLQAFKENYRCVHGPRMPIFLPDASLSGFQLLEQNFCFSGYTAPVPLFQPPGPHDDSRVLSNPQVYSEMFYARDIPQDFAWDGRISCQQAGTLNAIGFLTNNFLAFLLQEQRAVQWMMNQLILPLSEPLKVRAGDDVTVSFRYQAGCPLEALQDAIHVDRVAVSLPLRRAA